MNRHELVGLVERELESLAASRDRAVATMKQLGNDIDQFRAACQERDNMIADLEKRLKGKPPHAFEKMRDAHVRLQNDCTALQEQNRIARENVAKAVEELDVHIRRFAVAEAARAKAEAELDKVVAERNNLRQLLEQQKNDEFARGYKAGGKAVIDRIADVLGQPQMSNEEAIGILEGDRK